MSDEVTEGGGTGGEVGAEGGGGTPAPEAPAPSTWQNLMAGLPPELSTNPILDPYGQGDEPRGLAGLVADHINVQHLIGGEKIARPKADAAPEDWDRFYNEMGRPEKAAEYDLGDFAPPDGIGWDPGLQQNMMEDLHEAGLSNGQVNKVLRAYSNRMLEQGQAMQLNNQQLSQEATKNLDEKWGAAKDANVQVASRAFLEAFGPEQAAAIENVVVDGFPLGSHPAIVEAFFNLGSRMREHKMFGDQDGVAAQGPMTPAQAQAELSAMERDADMVKLWTSGDRSNPEVQALMRRRAALQEMATPNE